jgi:hypothetical protein
VAAIPPVATPPVASNEPLLFDLHEYRAKRNRKLEREVDVLRAERDRLVLLLGWALKVAAGGTEVEPTTLLDILCVFLGTDPAKLALDERNDRRERERKMDRLVEVLRETAP